MDALSLAGLVSDPLGQLAERRGDPERGPCADSEVVVHVGLVDEPPVAGRMPGEPVGVGEQRGEPVPQR
jgi:hypothetical protein